MRVRCVSSTTSLIASRKTTPFLLSQDLHVRHILYYYDSQSAQIKNTLRNRHRSQFALHGFDNHRRSTARCSRLIAGERVHVVNNMNGERIETYVIRGERNSGCICLNGAAARRFQVGDEVIIMAYAGFTPEEAKDFTPKVVFPNAQNALD